MGLIFIMDYLNSQVSIVIKTNFLCIIKMWKNRMTEYLTVSYWGTRKTQKMTLSVVVILENGNTIVLGNVKCDYTHFLTRDEDCYWIQFDNIY